MKNIFFISFTILFFFAQFFISCKSTKLKNELNPVYITNFAKFYLLQPENIENPIDEQQLFTGNFGENSFSFICYLKADENEIFLSLFNEIGAGIGTLTYDGISCNLDSNYFPENLKAEYIIADLQFAFYKEEKLKKEIEKLNLSFTQQIQNQKVIRTIKQNEKTIEQITKYDKSVKIVNNLRGYSYELIQE